MQYEAPAFLFTLWQGLLAIIFITFIPLAKIQWTKMSLADDESYGGHKSRFTKMIIAMVAIICIEVIVQFVKSIFS